MPRSARRCPFSCPGSMNSRCAAGFKPIHRPAILLEADQAGRLDLSLEVGALSESMEIRATAPLLGASSGAVGQLIEWRQFRDPPLNDGSTLGSLSATAW